LTNNCKNTIVNYSDVYRAFDRSYVLDNAYSLSNCSNSASGSVNKTMRLYCKDDIPVVKKNIFRYEYNEFPQYEFYCEDLVKTCTEQGQEKVIFSDTRLNNFQYIETILTCVSKSECTITTNGCETKKKGQTIYRYCIEPSNTPINTPTSTNEPTITPINTQNKFAYKYVDAGNIWYCKENIADCGSYGMKFFAFTNNSNGGAGYLMKESSTCVTQNECTMDGTVCKSNSNGEKRYLFCEETAEITNTPTNTPIGTPANTPTITPTPDFTNAVKCGPMDYYNVEGEPVGDGLITSGDFTAFVNIYGKTCNDDDIDYGKCGGKNRRLYEGDHKVDVDDFVYFIAVFNEKSCDINDLYELPQTGSETKIESINYIIVIVLEIITTIIILFSIYNYKKYYDEQK